MSPAEHKKSAREQLHELRDDVTDLEVRLKHGGPTDERVEYTCDAVRRLINDKLWELFPHVRADD